MNTIWKLLAILCISNLLVSCSDNDQEPGSYPSFSLQSPGGKILKDGEEILVNELDEYGELKMIAWVVNNTDKSLTLVVSHRILSATYDNIVDYTSYCWDICYNAPAPTTSNERTWEGKEIFKGFSGDIKDFDVPTTPDFETIIEYTIKNIDTGEIQRVKGHFIYKKA